MRGAIDSVARPFCRVANTSVYRYVGLSNSPPSDSLLIWWTPFEPPLRRAGQVVTQSTARAMGHGISLLLSLTTIPLEVPYDVLRDGQIVLPTALLFYLSYPFPAKLLLSVLPHDLWPKAASCTSSALLTLPMATNYTASSCHFAHAPRSGDRRPAMG